MGFAPIDPRRFADRVGSWLLESGPEADTVVSCRVRLARNVAGYPFVLRLEPDRAEELCAKLRDVLEESDLEGEPVWVAMDDASAVMRLLLRERNLVSRDLAPTDPRLSARPGRGVVFSTTETVSVMINEEDHLRLQSLSGGLSLRSAWERLCRIDQQLEGPVGYAYTDELGYLTGCPTNVGTGLRASVMLHLPALGLVRKELEKVFTAAQRTGLAVRGMYGEGSRAAGDFYQISNQVTLGRSEDQLIGDLESLVPSIVAFERRVRVVLYEEQGASLEDRVNRSLGMLRTARSLPTEVALMHLSNVRLGACIGILPGLRPTDLNRIAIQIQKAHVHTLSGGAVGAQLAEPTERDRQRATFLRKRFAELQG